MTNPFLQSQIFFANGQQYAGGFNPQAACNQPPQMGGGMMGGVFQGVFLIGPMAGTQPGGGCFHQNNNINNIFVQGGWPGSPPQQQQQQQFGGCPPLGPNNPTGLVQGQQYLLQMGVNAAAQFAADGVIDQREMGVIANNPFVQAGFGYLAENGALPEDLQFDGTFTPIENKPPKYNRNTTPTDKPESEQKVDKKEEKKIDAAADPKTNTNNTETVTPHDHSKGGCGMGCVREVEGRESKETVPKPTEKKTEATTSDLSSEDIATLLGNTKDVKDLSKKLDSIKTDLSKDDLDKRVETLRNARGSETEKITQALDVSATDRAYIAGRYYDKYQKSLHSEFDDVMDDWTWGKEGSRGDMLLNHFYKGCPEMQAKILKEYLDEYFFDGSEFTSALVKTASDDDLKAIMNEYKKLPGGKTLLEAMTYHNGKDGEGFEDGVMDKIKELSKT